MIVDIIRCQKSGDTLLDVLNKQANFAEVYTISSFVFNFKLFTILLYLNNIKY